MLISKIDFPEELLRAQVEGNLVVFAGAGVSHPPPSSLPLFTGLAAQIGLPSGTPKRDKEPEDRYLGRIHKNGVNVHGAAARLLLNEATKPNDLHHLLLRLFSSSNRTRLVTTNFDDHFKTAAQTVFAEEPILFCAPALPLGNDFTGIVYLHGSAAEAPRHCVLTDEDFGRAYLTSAWASRFLAAMFSEYVVLFVGYSHDDTVMNYLARGLPPVTQKPRFALTTDDSRVLDKWTFLGIHPIKYARQRGRYPHHGLNIGLRGWVAELQRGLLEKAQTIRSIAEAKPPLQGEDADYIRFSLGSITTAKLFFQYARDPEWLSWLEKEGFLNALFDIRYETSDFDRELAWWLTTHFLEQHPWELIALLQRHSSALHPYFCWAISRRLHARETNRTGTVFSYWVSILLRHPALSLPYDEWCLLLKSCRFPHEKFVSLRLFEFVTRPIILLQQQWRALVEETDEQKVDFDISLSAPLDHWLSEAWDLLFAPNIAAYATELAAIVTVNLAAADGWLRVDGLRDRDFDPFRFHRQSVSAVHDVRFRQTIDVLIDAGRAVIDELLRVNRLQATTLVNTWFNSEAALLRRLAIYGFARRQDISPDEKVQWLLDNDLLYRFKTDVFEFLELSYPKVSESLKKRVIARALEGDCHDAEGVERTRTWEYEVYNLVVWLARVAPESQITRTTRDTLQQQHTDFAPRTNPELDISFGGAEWIEPTKNIDAKKIAAEPPETFLNKLECWRPQDPLDDPRPNFCAVVAHVTTESTDWGIRFLRILSIRGLNDPDLWQSVCQGWRNSNLGADEWKVVIAFAEITQGPPEFFTAFAEVLESGSRREQHAIPDDLMQSAQLVAERIWKVALSLTAPEQTNEEDWLSVAINRPGGKLAHFWLQRISVARRSAGISWQHLPSELALKITEILRSQAGAAEHARVVFSSHLHYFFSLDPNFTNAEMLPLFDWQANTRKAEQCWHGFLWWGRWLSGFTERLLPQFTESVSHLKNADARLRERLIDHIAIVALFQLKNPLTRDWFGRILRELTEEQQGQLAAVIGRLLYDTEPRISEEIWDRWLKTYWEMRLLGTPKPLTTREATEMVFWAVSLGERLPDAIKLITPLQDRVLFEHGDLLLRIDRKGITKSQTEASADLVLFFLRAKPKHFFYTDHVGAIWKDLNAGGVLPEKLREIREAMFALGYDPQHPPVQ